MNFDELFCEATGFPPFPWQQRLFHRLLDGSVPDAVDIPTGLGKTSVMVIWLLARAQASQLPRRLVYVVDRRSVVDQATTEAERLRAFVENHSSVKNGLKLQGPLPISTLRGQFVDNKAWLEDPSSPAIVVGTIDMVGSRLLFGGYGVSRKMRPYHAGLLGVDAVLVLDESHLVPPFEGLLRAMQSDAALHASDASCRKVLPPFRMMSLSATGLEGSVDIHSLGDDDLEHPVVKNRLNAEKRIELVQLAEGSKLEDSLVEQAWNVGNAREPRRVVVYANSRDIAQKVVSGLEKRAKSEKASIQIELLVGARRVFERTMVRDRLSELGFIPNSSGSSATAPTYLVATSAGEVGVDLDADDMVCDLVAWERMVQRLGRVNRRGQGCAQVVVVLEPKPTRKKAEENAFAELESSESLSSKDRKKYERTRRKVEARERAWEARQVPFKYLPTTSPQACDASMSLQPQDDLFAPAPAPRNEALDGSPGALRDLSIRSKDDEEIRQALAAATTPEPLRPALTRPLVDAWAMTSLKEHTGRPALAPWLRGWLPGEPPETTVIWRKHLPTCNDGVDFSKSELVKRIERYFEAAPVHTSEVLNGETDRVVDWLRARSKALQKLGGVFAEDSIVGLVLDSDGRLRDALQLCDLLALDSNDKQVAKEKKEMLSGPEGLLSAARLVLDARVAGLSRGLLDPKVDDPAYSADGGQKWLDEGTVGFRVRLLGEQDEQGDRDDAQWRLRYVHVLQRTAEGEATRSLAVDKWWADSATEEDRSIARPQRLDDHQQWVERHAGDIGTRLDLCEEYLSILKLAARLHDEGKAASRWQRAFRAESAAADAGLEGPLAKTDRAIDFALLDGYRHELGSLLKAEKDSRIAALAPESRRLALHLIAAHHGFARPIISARSCDHAPPSALQESVMEIALCFAELQSRWGPWGLAWWESLLRAADQAASRENASSALEVKS